MYRCSDKLILLSSSFSNEWAAVLKENDIPKAISIPNMVSYNEYFKAEDIQQKEKIALVVARLDEGQKKISRILKVWKDIETIDTFKDWNLVIVGTGKDETKYKQNVQFYKENLSPNEISKTCKIYNREYHSAVFCVPNFVKELAGV